MTASTSVNPRRTTKSGARGPRDRPLPHGTADARALAIPTVEAQIRASETPPEIQAGMTPKSSTEHPQAVVSARGAGRWRAGHPWIYRSDVRAIPDVPAGAVEVREANGRTVGMALWSPVSQISLRMLTRELRPIDADFWAE